MPRLSKYALDLLETCGTITPEARSQYERGAWGEPAGDAARLDGLGERRGLITERLRLRMEIEAGLLNLGCDPAEPGAERTVLHFPDGSGYEIRGPLREKPFVGMEGTVDFFYGPSEVDKIRRMREEWVARQINPPMLACGDEHDGVLCDKPYGHPGNAHTGSKGSGPLAWRAMWYSFSGGPAPAVYDPLGPVASSSYLESLP